MNDEKPTELELAYQHVLPISLAEHCSYTGKSATNWKPVLIHAVVDAYSTIQEKNLNNLVLSLYSKVKTMGLDDTIGFTWRETTYDDGSTEDSRNKTLVGTAIGLKRVEQE